MTIRSSVSILIQDTMDRLEEIGIHSILVRSKEEAKNFIMYHIDIGTQIRIDDCLELEDLNLERAIVEKGGTILNHEEESLETKESQKRKPTISKLNLYGSSYIFKEFNEFTHYNIESNNLLNCIDGEKTIAVINACLNDTFHKKLLLTYKRIVGTHAKATSNTKPRMLDKESGIISLDIIQRNIGQENINNDISVVFIE